MKNLFPTDNDLKRFRLRRRELDGRIQTLSKLVKDHGGDPDFRLSVHAWRRELMDARMEKAGVVI